MKEESLNDKLNQQDILKHQFDPEFPEKQINRCVICDAKVEDFSFESTDKSLCFDCRKDI